MTTAIVPRQRSVVAVDAFDICARACIDGTPRMTNPANSDCGGKAQRFWLDHLGAADNFNRWVFETFEPWLHGEILELGCGTGNFTTLMAERGLQVTGLDIEPSYVEQAARRIAPWPNAAVKVMDVTQLGDGPLYDTVVLLDVLEHIEHDGRLLESIGTRLRPEGRVILKVPAIPSIYSQMDQAIGHFRRYDRATLVKRLQEAGFKPVKITPLNAAGILGWWLNGKVLGRTVPPAGQVGAFNRVVPLIGRIERALRLPFGLSLIAFSTKSGR